MRIRYAARTDVGLKRAHNEDYFALSEQDRLFMVADGMGGHASGDIASRLATTVVGAFYRESRNQPERWPYTYDPEASYPENRMTTAIRLANDRIHEEAQRHHGQRGMGTTIVTLHLDGEDGYVAHVGDSRCYRIRPREIVSLTRDHSLFEDWKSARPHLTEDEIRNFPHKNVITRALGMRNSVDVDICRFAVQDGDSFLLCSDGLSGMLDDAQIYDIVTAMPDPEHAVAELVDRSNTAGGGDNISAMLVECRF